MPYKGQGVCIQTLVTSHAPKEEEEEKPVRPSVKTSQGGRQSYDLREGKS